MHYIRCDHCGELIEVKSEYMTFCPKCELKLNNSYTAWRAKSANVGKSFRDYLGEMTVSASTLEGVKEQQKISREIGRSQAAKRMGWAVLIAFAVVVAGAGIYWFAATKGGNKATIKALLDSETWKIAYYSDLGATVKFPYPLEKVSAFVADSLQQEDSLQTQQQIILSAVSRKWARSGVISVSASRLDYKPDFGVDRDVATGQILQSMLAEGNEGEPAIRGFEFFKNDYSIPNIDARSMAGRYLAGPEAFEFRALMAQYRHTVWYFMVAYPRNTPEGTLVAERFFRGLLLDRKLEE